MANNTGINYDEILNKNYLYQKYVIEKQSTKNIAKDNKCDRSTIERRLKQYNIEIRGRKQIFKILTKEFLEDQYINKNKVSTDISKEYGFSPTTIIKYLRKYNIEIRTHDEYYIDLKENTYGKWTVLEPAKSYKGHKYWKCQCECGTIKMVCSSWLIHGQSTQCKQCCNKKQFYKDISLTFWNDIQNGALQRNIDFKITKEQVWDLYIKQDRKCALSGIEIKFATSRNIRGNLSIDRIDSSGIYEISNIQLVDSPLNQMKWILSQKEFIEKCRLVTEFQKNKRLS